MDDSSGAAAGKSDQVKELENEELLRNLVQLYAGHRWPMISNLLIGCTCNPVMNHSNPTLKRDAAAAGDVARPLEKKPCVCDFKASSSGYEVIDLDPPVNYEPRSATLEGGGISTQLSLAPPGREGETARSCACTGDVEAPTRSFGPEFMALVQEMVREEVKNAMSKLRRQVEDGGSAPSASSDRGWNI